MAAAACAQTTGGVAVSNDSPLFDEPPSAPVIRLAQNTEDVSRDATATPDLSGPPGKRGLLQSIDFSADWVPRFETDGLGRSTFSAGVGVGVPPMLLGAPLLIKPSASIDLIDGPDFVDVPDSVNGFALSIGTFKKLSERWMANVNVTVGVYGDDHSLGESEALRVSGMAMAIWNRSPQVKWFFGAAYLNRDDISVLPILGFTYDSGEVRYELTMPRPRIAWRLSPGPCGEERSLYVGGDLGGGAWAVRRDDGSTDTLNLARWGIVIGYEKAAAPTLGLWEAGGWKTRYELGYLFGRDLEYAEGGEEFAIDDSLVARVGWSY